MTVLLSKEELKKIVDIKSIQKDLPWFFNKIELIIKNLIIFKKQCNYNRKLRFLQNLYIYKIKYKFVV